MRSKLVKGTLILTIAGFLSRILGFGYKLFLSQYLGSELLGIYQLIFPVYGICFTLYGSGIQTAISKVVSEYQKRNKALIPSILSCGMMLSILLATLCSLILFFFSEPIAIHFLKEPRCESLVKVLSFTFPACSLSACINGFYFGQTKTKHPAIAQLIEQVSRIAFTLAACFLFTQKYTQEACDIAVFAIAIGEITAMLYNVMTLCHKSKQQPKKREKGQSLLFLRKILSFSIPLTCTHFSVSILHALENILIPLLLQTHGFSSSNALSLYGILTGMTLPLLLFPSTIFNSISVLLLPSISQANATKQHGYIKKAISTTLYSCLLTGIGTSAFFCILGKFLGNLLFHNTLAGTYLSQLSFICPMLYLNAMFASILNGLDKTTITFRNTTCSLLLRIALFYFLIPNLGIAGYFVSMLTSELFSTCFHWISLRPYRI